jgi:hypothetical protein
MQVPDDPDTPKADDPTDAELPGEGPEDLSVANLNSRDMYADGGGLMLQVSESGTKAWLFRYMRFGKRHHLGLGPLHI